MDKTGLLFTFTRRVYVNRNPRRLRLANSQILVRYSDPRVMKKMPHGVGEYATVTFFQVGYLISDDQLEKEYEWRCLKPVDPYALIAVNEEDLHLMTEFPNATHWKGRKDKWCVACFAHYDSGRYESGRSVSFVMHTAESAWGPGWWFAGVPKST